MVRTGLVTTTRVRDSRATGSRLAVGLVTTSRVVIGVALAVMVLSEVVVQGFEWRLLVPHALTLLLALPARHFAILVGWSSGTLVASFLLEDLWPLAVAGSAVLGLVAAVDAAVVGRQTKIAGDLDQRP